MKYDLPRVARRWTPFTVVTTALYLFATLAMIDGARSVAYDSPREIARNIDLALDEGTDFKLFNSTRPVQIGKSLTPYVLLFDMNGTPMGGSGSVSGNFPVPPRSVFDAALERGEYDFVWEPTPSAKEAVVARYHSGKNAAFVLSGRSLTLVDARIRDIAFRSTIFWAATLFALFVTLLALPKND